MSNIIEANNPLKPKKKKVKANVKSNYFCEFCNRQIPGKDLFEEHNESTYHNERKKTLHEALTAQKNYCFTCDKTFDTKLELDSHCLLLRHQQLYRNQAVVKALENIDIQIAPAVKAMLSSRTMLHPKDSPATAAGKIATKAESRVSEQSVEKAVKTEQSKPSRSIFYCKICDVDCLNVEKFKMHMESWKHRANIDNMREGNLRPLPSQSADHSGDRGGKQEISTTQEVQIKAEMPMKQEVSTSVPKTLHDKANYYCDVCNIPCSGETNYMDHINGKKHHRKVSQLKPPFRCYVCNESYNNEPDFKTHLGSSSHIKVAFAGKSDKIEDKKGGSVRVSGEVGKIAGKRQSNQKGKEEGSKRDRTRNNSIRSRSRSRSRSRGRRGSRQKNIDYSPRRRRISSKERRSRSRRHKSRSSSRSSSSSSSSSSTNSSSSHSRSRERRKSSKKESADRNRGSARSKEKSSRKSKSGEKDKNTKSTKSRAKDAEGASLKEFSERKEENIPDIEASLDRKVELVDEKSSDHSVKDLREKILGTDLRQKLGKIKSSMVITKQIKKEPSEEDMATGCRDNVAPEEKGDWNLNSIYSESELAIKQEDDNVKKESHQPGSLDLREQLDERALRTVEGLREDSISRREQLLDEREKGLLKYHDLEEEFKKFQLEGEYLKRRLELHDTDEDGRNADMRDLAKVEYILQDIQQELEAQENMIREKEREIVLERELWHQSLELERQNTERDLYEKKDVKVFVETEEKAVDGQPLPPPKSLWSAPIVETVKQEKIVFEYDNKSVLNPFETADIQASKETDMLSSKREFDDKMPLSLPQGYSSPPRRSPLPEPFEERSNIREKDLRQDLEKERLLKKLQPELEAVDPALRARIVNAILAKEELGGPRRDMSEGEEPDKASRGPLKSQLSFGDPYEKERYSYSYVESAGQSRPGDYDDLYSYSLDKRERVEEDIYESEVFGRGEPSDHQGGSYKAYDRPDVRPRDDHIRNMKDWIGEPITERNNSIDEFGMRASSLDVTPIDNSRKSGSKRTSSSKERERVKSRRSSESRHRSRKRESGRKRGRDRRRSRDSSSSSRSSSNSRERKKEKKYREKEKSSLRTLSPERCGSYESVLYHEKFLSLVGKDGPILPYSKAMGQEDMIVPSDHGNVNRALPGVIPSEGNFPVHVPMANNTVCSQPSQGLPNTGSGWPPMFGSRLQYPHPNPIPNPVSNPAALSGPIPPQRFPGFGMVPNQAPMPNVVRMSVPPNMHSLPNAMPSNRPPAMQNLLYEQPRMALPVVPTMHRPQMMPQPPRFPGITPVYNTIDGNRPLPTVPMREGQAIQVVSSIPPSVNVSGHGGPNFNNMFSGSVSTDQFKNPYIAPRELSRSSMAQSPTPLTMESISNRAEEQRFAAGSRRGYQHDVKADLSRDGGQPERDSKKASSLLKSKTSSETHKVDMWELALESSDDPGEAIRPGSKDINEPPFADPSQFLSSRKIYPTSEQGLQRTRDSVPDYRTLSSKHATDITATSSKRHREYLYEKRDPDTGKGIKKSILKQPTKHFKEQPVDVDNKDGFQESKVSCLPFSQTESERRAVPESIFSNSSELSYRVDQEGRRNALSRIMKEPYGSSDDSDPVAMTPPKENIPLLHGTYKVASSLEREASLHQRESLQQQTHERRVAEEESEQMGRILERDSVTLNRNDRVEEERFNAGSLSNKGSIPSYGREKEGHANDKGRGLPFGDLLASFKRQWPGTEDASVDRAVKQFRRDDGYVAGETYEDVSESESTPKDDAHGLTRNEFSYSYKEDYDQDRTPLPSLGGPKESLQPRGDQQERISVHGDHMGKHGGAYSFSAQKEESPYSVDVDSRTRRGYQFHGERQPRPDVQSYTFDKEEHHGLERVIEKRPSKPEQTEKEYEQKLKMENKSLKPSANVTNAPSKGRSNQEEDVSGMPNESSPFKRDRPDDSNLSQEPKQAPNPATAGPFCCDACKLKFSTRVSLDFHMSTQKHAQTVRNNRFPSNTPVVNAKEKPEAEPERDVISSPSNVKDAEQIAEHETFARGGQEKAPSKKITVSSGEITKEKTQEDKTLDNDQSIDKESRSATSAKNSDQFRRQPSVPGPPTSSHNVRGSANRGNIREDASRRFPVRGRGRGRGEMAKDPEPVDWRHPPQFGRRDEGRNWQGERQNVNDRQEHSRRPFGKPAEDRNVRGGSAHRPSGAYWSSGRPQQSPNFGRGYQNQQRGGHIPSRGGNRRFPR